MDRMRATRQADRAARKQAAAAAPKAKAKAKAVPNGFEEPEAPREGGAPLRPEAIDSCLGQFYEEL